MSHKYFLMFMIFFAFSGLLAQIPFHPYDILNSFGEDQILPDGEYYLHPGLDLCGDTTTTQVTPVESGYIFACVKNEEGGYDIRTHTTLPYGWIYGHTDSLPEVLMNILRRNYKIPFTPSLLKFTIAPRTGTCPHLHLEKVRYCQSGWYDADNPIAYISPIADYHPPVIEDYGFGYDIFLCRDEQWGIPFTTKDNCFPQNIIVNGHVDFSSKVTEQIISSNTGIHAIGYRIENIAGSIVAPEKINYARGILYHPGFSAYIARKISTLLCEFPSVYKVSNCTGGIFDLYSLQGYWNTKQHKDREWNEADAESIRVAKFPDGLYNIVIIAEDYAGNRAERSFRVRVDNFNPIVTKPQCLKSPLKFKVSEPLDTANIFSLYFDFFFFVSYGLVITSIQGVQYANHIVCCFVIVFIEFFCHAFRSCAIFSHHRRAKCI